jgi:hypothetical protein
MPVNINAACCVKQIGPVYLFIAISILYRNNRNMRQIMRYTSKTHTLTQIMYTTDYFQGEITLNSMFVSFSIPTRVHCRELKFIFCLRTEYI